METTGDEWDAYVEQIRSAQDVISEARALRDAGVLTDAEMARVISDAATS